MIPNLKDVLDTKEYNQYISLLKDIAPNQLKIYQSNGCIEMLEEEKHIFNQLKKDVKPFFDKLNKTWFT